MSYSKLFLDVLRCFLFIITMIVSLFVFIFYCAIKIDDNTYYRSDNITKAQSDDIKELIGFSQFTNLTVKGFDYRLTSDNESVSAYTFDITITENEFQDFSEYIKTEMPQIDYRNYLDVVIVEDNPIMNEPLYKSQLKYITQGDGQKLYYISKDDDVRYAAGVWIIIPQFILLMLVNSLIILPYKDIISFIRKKVSPRKVPMH